MHDALRQFESNMISARQIGAIYKAFAGHATAALRLDELLRAEVVAIVSAMDCYIHDVVRVGMTQWFLSSRDEPSAFKNSSVSLSFAKCLVSAPARERAALVEGELRRINGYRTFQRSGHIAEALGLIGIKSVWDSAGKSLSMSTTDVKTRLDMIVQWRDRIAHESDIDPTSGVGNKYSIAPQDVEDSADFLERVVRAIHSIVAANAI